MWWIVFALIIGTSGPIDQLGSDDWNEREAAHQRLDNFWCVLVLPKSNTNPEIDARLKELHVHWDNYPEKQLYKYRYWTWFEEFIVQRESQISCRRSCYERMLDDDQYREAFMDRYDIPTPFEEWWGNLPVFATYEGFVEHLNRYDKRIISAYQISEALLPYPIR